LAFASRLRFGAGIVPGRFPMGGATLTGGVVVVFAVFPLLQEQLPPEEAPHPPVPHPPAMPHPREPHVSAAFDSFAARSSADGF
jgi:hypothetical protein